MTFVFDFDLMVLDLVFPWFMVVFRWFLRFMDRGQHLVNIWSLLDLLRELSVYWCERVRFCKSGVFESIFEGLC